MSEDNLKERMEKKPLEILERDEIKIEIYKKNEGPWPFNKSDCLHCYEDTVGYAYVDNGYHVAMRFCDSNECKEKSIDWAVRTVKRWSEM